MNDLITNSELRSYLDNEEFILKTQQQLAKDFAKFETQFLAITTDPDFIAKISEKILFREAYKVFLRRKFS